MDHLLHDWLMARASPDSGAIEIAKDGTAVGAMIVGATDAAARTRARMDPALLLVTTDA